MPPRSAAEKGEKMFTADVVAAVLYSTGTTSLSMKNYEMMSSLDGRKSACAFQHEFRSVLAKAKELKARVEGGEEFKAVPSSAKRPQTTMPLSAAKKRKRDMSSSDVDEMPSKKGKRGMSVSDVETPSKKRTKCKKEAGAVAPPKFVLGSSKDILESVPEDVEDFIKGEDKWEEDFV